MQFVNKSTWGKKKCAIRWNDALVKYCGYQICILDFLANNCSSDSTWSGSGKQQSTGQTAAH